MSNILIATDARFIRLPDGSVHAEDPSSNYQFFNRYLKAFTLVTVLARIKDVSWLPSGTVRASGENVRFHPLPYYLGPWQFLRKFSGILRRMTVAVQSSDAICIRVPGVIGFGLWLTVRSKRRPIAIEVVGDPWAALAPGTVPSVVRPLARLLFTYAQRKLCAEAIAVSYVSSTLQRIYPPSPVAFVTRYSSVELAPMVIVGSRALARRLAQIDTKAQNRASVWKLIFVGSLALLYKAPDIFLEAIQLCINSGLNLTATIVGGGKYQIDIENMAQRIGLRNQVSFTGQLPMGDCIYQKLDEADLFVMPSRTEGLPRAMIEAMARGCPCIGTSVGGIPELLASEDMVAPNNSQALAIKITEVLSDSERMKRMATRNVEVAQSYRSDILSNRRQTFYEETRRQAEVYWQKHGRNIKPEFFRPNEF